MTTLAQLAIARAARDEAHDAFYRRLSQVQEDLQARGIGGRIADRVGEEARDLFDQALEVADEHPGAIAGTIAAMALWFLRNPIITRLQRMLADEEETENVGK